MYICILLHSVYKHIVNPVEGKSFDLYLIYFIFYTKMNCLLLILYEDVYVCALLRITTMYYGLTVYSTILDTSFECIEILILVRHPNQWLQSNN